MARETFAAWRARARLWLRHRPVGRILLDRGYDVHGVDVVDWWQRDDYWDKSYVPGARFKERLHRVEEANYRIPFPVEGHLFLLFPVLCYYNAYLSMWAILGRRSPDQKGLT